MFNTNETSPIMTVHRKISGAHRENSLYHFVFDHHATVFNDQYRLSFSKPSRIREAIYIDVPLNSDLQSPFPGYSLVEQHLTIDKVVKSEASSLSKKYSPAHATLIYEQADERRVVHVYYNRHGHLIDMQAKSYLKLMMSAGVEFPINLAEKKLIHTQSLSCHGLLTEVLEKKSNKYLELYQQSFEQDQALAMAYTTNNLETILQKTQDLKSIVQQLSRYSDTKQDGRSFFLSNMLEVGLLNKSASDVHQVDKNLSGTQEEIISIPKAIQHPDKSSPKKIRQEQRIAAEKTTITALVQNINTYHGAMTTGMMQRNEEQVCRIWLELQPKLRQLHSLFMTFEFDSALSKNDKKFINQQRSSLLVDENGFANYFKDRVLDGDLNSVSTLYPLWIESVNARDMFHTVIQMIIKSTSSDYCEHKWVPIADYFYEHSDIYRSIFRVNKCIFTYNNKTQSGMGCLYGMFINNNLSGFRLALRQGVSPHDVQFILGEKTFNALQMLILFFSKNPNIAFVMTLCEHGASMEFSRNWCSETSRSLIKHSSNIKSNVLKPFGQPNTHELDDAIAPLHEIDQALTLAMQTNGYLYPELISRLALASDAACLFMNASSLVSSNEFGIRFLSPSLSLRRQVFESSESCLDEIRWAIQNPRADHNKVSFAFYLNSPSPMTIEMSSLIHSLAFLLGQARTSYSALPLAEQRAIRSKLMIPKDGTLLETMIAYRAAQLAYDAMGVPMYEDQDVMVKLFCMIAVNVKKVDISISNRGYYNAKAFLESLPATDLERHNVIYQQICKKIEIIDRELVGISMFKETQGQAQKATELPELDTSSAYSNK